MYALKPFSWSVSESNDETDKIYINIIGKNKQNISTHIRVYGFRPYVYLEFKDKNFDISHYERIQDVLIKKGKPIPVNYEYEDNFNLYQKIPMKTVKVYFNNNIEQKKFCSSFNYDIIDYSTKDTIVRAKEVLVHENNIEHLLKFTTQKKLQLSNWLVYTPINKDYFDFYNCEEDFSVCKNQYNVHIDNIFNAPDIFQQTNPNFLSIDLECYSENHESKIPDPNIEKNVIFQISIYPGTIGVEKLQKPILLSIFSPNPIDDTEQYNFNKFKMFKSLSFDENIKNNLLVNEKNLILKFASLIKELDPDIFIGYNILKFDWNYLITRAEKHGCIDQFLNISRDKNIVGVATEGSWQSSAYGKQTFRYPTLNGRVHVDVMIEIERNYKLSSYSLNSASGYFLGEQKEDISAKQLFMLFYITYKYSYIDYFINNKLEQPSTLENVKKEIHLSMPQRKLNKILYDFKKSLLKANTFEELSLIIRTAMTLTGTYCIQDTALPIKLCNKLKLWTTMEELSNCSRVPMSYLHTRGQQIRVLSLLYEKCKDNNIVIPTADPNKKNPSYEGAYVVTGEPGIYENVAVLDFTSLYPSIIISENICFTTLIQKEYSDNYSPDDYRAISWEEHIGCEHDPLKRKISKIEKIKCNKHDYKWLKVKFDEFGNKTNEGLLPALLRNVLAQRKKAKSQMEYVEAEVEMTLGLTTPEKYEKYKSYGWVIIKPGTFSSEEIILKKVEISVLNARQAALKVIANSVYGFTGIREGAKAPLIEGAASVTYIGRMNLRYTIEKQLEIYKKSVNIYGDTDSCMIKYNCQKLEQNFDRAEQACELITHYLKCKTINVDPEIIFTDVEGQQIPLLGIKKNKINSLVNPKHKIICYKYFDNTINLDFEKMFGWFCFFTKKRYIGLIINSVGKVEKEMSKGNVLVRRDNSKIVKSIFKAVLDSIKKKATREEVLLVFYEQINKIFTKQFPLEFFIITKSIKDVFSYAMSIVDIDSDEKKYYIDCKDLSEEEKGEIRKSKKDDYVFLLKKINENRKANNKHTLKLFETDDVNDPKLYYPKPPSHLMLAQRMMHRGDIVPANTRMEYVILKIKGGDTNDTVQGDKLEDYTYYKENKDILKLQLDYNYYYEKQIINPLSELIETAFPLTKKLFFEREYFIIEYYKKHFDIKDFFKIIFIEKPKIENIINAVIDKLKNITKYKYITTKDKENSLFVCYSSLHKKIYYTDKTEYSDADFEETKNIIEKHITFINLVKTEYSARMITKMLKKNSEKAKPEISSLITRNNQKLNTEIGYLTFDKNVSIKGVIISSEEVEITAKKKIRKYTLELDNGKKIENALRSSFGIYYLVDEKFMEKINEYHIYYSAVVAQLNLLFSPKYKIHFD